MEDLYNKVGISAQATPGLVPIGIAASGTPLYGSPAAVNDNTPNLPANLLTSYKTGLNTIGAADKATNERLDDLISKIKNPTILDELNRHRASNDTKQFQKTLGQYFGTKDAQQGKAIYDAWGVMTPNQKGAAILHAAVDSSSINSKEYVPGIDVNTALTLQKQGFPMKDIRGNFGQIQAISQAVGHDSDPVASIKQVTRGGFIGPAQNLTKSDVGYYQLSPAPQYGVGAVEMPNKGPKNIPSGFMVVGQKGQNRLVLAPKGNEASVSFNPEAESTAQGIYSTWKDANKLPALNGTQGGSNMYKGLTQMYDVNPQALGKALNFQIPGKGTLPEKAAGLALAVLSTGDPKGAKALSLDEIGQKLGSVGVQNRDVGYKLANQAYAEGRINDSHLFAIHRALDNVFHADNALSKIAPSDDSNFVGSKGTKAPVEKDEGNVMGAPRKGVKQSDQVGDAFNVGSVL